MRIEHLGENVTMYHGDCLEILPTLAAGSDWFTVTDPPYGIGESSARNSTRGKLAAVKDYGVNNWDNKRVDLAVFPEIFRLSNEQVIFGGQYYTDVLPPSPGWIVWNKQNGDNDFADCELAWTSYKRAVRKIDYLWNGMIKKYPEERVHLTQKPLFVMTWIVENYTPPACTVLDPFTGSGTTGVACVNLGRKFIGIEIDQKYFDIACKRIAQAQLQIRMDI